MTTRAHDAGVRVTGFAVTQGCVGDDVLRVTTRFRGRHFVDDRHFRGGDASLVIDNSFAMTLR